MPLQRQGLIEVWHDRDISVGTEWEQEITEQLNSAQIILLLISPDFMDSNYCYGIEMQRAMERHERKEAQVIPVILRPVYWQGAPFGKLQALPKDAIPITSRKWDSREAALHNVAEGIREVVEELIGGDSINPSTQPTETKIPASAKVSAPVKTKTPVPLHETPLAFRDVTVSPSTLPPRTRKLSPTPSVEPIKPEEFALQDILTKGSNYILSVTISPDGQTLASGNQDGTIKVWNLHKWKLLLWNLHKWKLLHTLAGHSNVVSSVAFSPDGKTLLSGGNDKAIKVWDLDTGKLLRTLEGHSEAVTSITISHDGKTLASGSYDKTIRIWNICSGELLHTFTEHADGVRSIAISPVVGKTLVSGSNDKTIKVWDLDARKLLRTLEGHSEAVTSIAFSPDGKTLASGSHDTTIKIWGKK